MYKTVGIEYREVTKAIKNPRRDRRTRYGIESKDIEPGMKIIVHTQEVDETELRDSFQFTEIIFGTSLYRDRIIATDLPPVDEWSKVIEPTTRQRITFELGHRVEDYILRTLIDEGTVTFEMVEEISKRPVED